MRRQRWTISSSSLNCHCILPFTVNWCGRGRVLCQVDQMLKKINITKLTKITTVDKNIAATIIQGSGMNVCHMKRYYHDVHAFSVQNTHLLADCSFALIVWLVPFTALLSSPCPDATVTFLAKLISVIQQHSIMQFPLAGPSVAFLPKRRNTYIWKFAYRRIISTDKNLSL